MSFDFMTRYVRDDMAEVWLSENKFYKWLMVELAVLIARGHLGQLMNVSQGDLSALGIWLREIKNNGAGSKMSTCPKINPREIDRIESEITRHDVVAFLLHISPQLPESLRPHFHEGMTSYDVVDTGQSLQIQESLDLVLEVLLHLENSLQKQAKKHWRTPMIGRTHGVHAEPITFGVRLANWLIELGRHRRRLQEVKEHARVGKISGAVGMYTLDPEVEEVALKTLGLRPILTTQIIARDVFTEVVMVMASLAATLAKICENIRLLSQTEIREIMEFFDRKNQRGSSAMPHKKNPIGTENISGLMRQVMAQVNVALENQAHCWHERSLDNSAPERVMWPIVFGFTHYALHRLAGIIEKLMVFPERMRANLDRLQGLVFSQDVMIMLAARGIPREQAHSLVRTIAIRCFDDDLDFLVELEKDPDIIAARVTEADLLSCFDLDAKLRHLGHLYEMVFDK